MELLLPFGTWYWNGLYIIGLLIYTIYAIVGVYRIVNESDTYIVVNQKRINKWNPFIGVRETFFPYQKHFTFYDLIRLFFIWPIIVLGIFFACLTEGISNFFPVLRIVFGVKIFRIRKDDTDE